MYLFSRSARLTGGDAAEWATTIGARAGEVLGNEVSLWATALSPNYGTVSWTSWWADLGSLETAMGGLVADAKYNELARAGAGMIEGPLDDLLSQTVTEVSENAATAVWVSSVRAVLAAGHAARGLSAGVAIAERFAAVSGTPALFVAGVTGVYGGVGWLSGYESLSAFEATEAKLATDPGWLEFIDGFGDCFVEDPAVTQSTLFVKMA